MIGLYSSMRMVSDGTLQTVALSFPYTSRDEIHVFVDGVKWGAGWSWADDTGKVIIFDYPIPEGQHLLVRRITKLEQVPYIFGPAAGSRGYAEFSALTVDFNFDFVLRANQDALDSFTLSGATAEAAQNWAQRAEAAAAAAKSSENSALASSSSASTQAQRAANEAAASAASAAAALTSQTYAATARNRAEQAEVAARGHRDEAQQSATQAGVSQSSAASSATSATQSASSAQSSASAAQGARAGAESASTAAQSAEARARQWADSDRGVPVVPGKFSAKHWAEVATDSAATIGDAVDRAEDAAVRAEDAAHNSSAQALREDLSTASPTTGGNLVSVTPVGPNTTPQTVESALQTTVRNEFDQNPVNKSRLWLSETGAPSPVEHGAYARSTPATATMTVYERLNNWGNPSRYYKWGIMSWITNPNTAPVTTICGIGEGFRVRGVEASGRQCGDGGEAHALEVLIGQFAARATVRTTEGSTTVDNFRNHRIGGRFCIGNEVKSTSLAPGSTIVSMTKDGKTYTAQGLQHIVVFTPGTGYSVGDVLEWGGIGGTWTVPFQIEVRTVDSNGGVVTANVLEQGNCTSPPGGSNQTANTKNISGTMAGRNCLVQVQLITCGMGYPDSIEVSLPAIASSNLYQMRAYGVANNNIGILVTGSGDGGPDGTGTKNCKGIVFNSYGDSKFEIGIQFNGHIRPDGRGISYEFVSAASGLYFGPSNNFTDGAIYLRGQNIATDTTAGMQIASASNQKMGFWGATPVRRPTRVVKPSPTDAGADVGAREALGNLIDKLVSIGLLEP